MIFPRRDGGTDRYLGIRMTLLFLGAGVWFGGVAVGDRRIELLAIALLAAGLLVGLVARLQARRRSDPWAPSGDDGDPID